MDMDTSTIISLAMTLISTISAAYAAISAWRAVRTGRQIEFVRLQLQELYGPIQFLTSWNAELFKLYRSFHEALDEEYISQQWSQEPLTRKRVTEDVTKTIEIGNRFIAKVEENNALILQTLECHYSLIEPDDIDLCAKFLANLTRRQVEFDEAGILETPFRIYRQLGDVSYMHPEFIDAIDKRFQKKKLELKDLLK